CSCVARFSTPPRPPPTSTLCPYTTLFRSPQKNRIIQEQPIFCFLGIAYRLSLLAARRPYGRRAAQTGRSIRANTLDISFPGRARSEEHTSELQSRENLVCRLLLEKQKKPN